VINGEQTLGRNGPERGSVSDYSQVSERTR